MTRIHQAPSGAVHISTPLTERIFYAVKTRVYEKHPDPLAEEDLVAYEALGTSGKQLRATTHTLRDAIQLAWRQKNRLRRGGAK